MLINSLGTEIDLHIRFDKSETQEGSQELFYSPVEDYQSPPYFEAPGSPQVQISDDDTQVETTPMADVQAALADEGKSATKTQKTPGRWSPATTITPLMPMPPPSKNVKTRRLANVKDQDVLSKISDDSGQLT